MKKLLVTSSAIVALLACSTPAYAAHFKILHHHGVTSGGSYPQKVLDTNTQVAFDSKANTCTIPTGLAAGSTITGTGIYNDGTSLEFNGGGTYTASAKNLDGYGVYVDGGSTATITGSFLRCGTGPSNGDCIYGFGNLNTGVDGGLSPAGIGHMILDHDYVDMAFYRSAQASQHIRSWNTSDIIEINYSCMANILTDAYQGAGTLLVTGSYFPAFGIDPSLDYSTHVENLMIHGDGIIQDSWFAQDDGSLHAPPGLPGHVVCVAACTNYGGMTGIFYVDTEPSGRTANVIIRRNIFTNDHGGVRYPLVIHGNGTTNVTIQDNLIQAGYDGYYTEEGGLIGTCTASGNRDYDTGLPIPNNVICPP
jgi:hypothetical protein